MPAWVKGGLHMKTKAYLLGLVFLALIGSALFVAFSPSPATAQQNPCALCMHTAAEELSECLARGEGTGKCTLLYREALDGCLQGPCSK